eukprot:COSAG02_NODE_4261_length_5577_cov_3.258306_2_plen_93_part_00
MNSRTSYNRASLEVHTKPEHFNIQNPIGGREKKAHCPLKNGPLGNLKQHQENSAHGLREQVEFSYKRAQKKQLPRGGQSGSLGLRVSSPYRT